MTTAPQRVSVLDKLAHEIVDQNSTVTLDSFTMSGVTALNQFNGELIELARQYCLDPQRVSRVDVFEIDRSHEYSGDYDLVLERVQDEFRSGRTHLDKAVAAVIVQIYRILEERDEINRDYLGD
jgi:hypothetical protein